MHKSIIIAGKNNIACETLQWLYDEYGKQINFFVICNRDDIGQNGWQRSLRQAANTLNVKEIQLEDAYSMRDTIFLSLEYDRIICPERFITKELYNVHFSLLPQYKGMYTTILPILHGEKMCGVTLHRIDSGIDTGEIICQKSLELDKKYTSRDLYYEYMQLGVEIIKENIKDIIGNKCKSYAQSIEKSSYYRKGSIDFKKEIDTYNTAIFVQRQIRAFRFREYQMPRIGKWFVSSCDILDIRSHGRPGQILYQDDQSVVISTIDYNVELHIDQFDRVFKACHEGDLATLQTIKGLEYYLKDRNSQGKTPLMVAVDANQLRIVNYLISLHESVNVKMN